MSIDMTYLQMCLGFVLGYVIVAFVLLPLYYKYRLTSIYTYLDHRFGAVSYKTGSSFFILSKLLGAAAKFYVVCRILQLCLADSFSVPYVVIVLVALFLIWLYTRRGGIKTLVWTDSFQTVCMFTALLLIIYKVIGALDLSVGEAFTAVANHEHSRMFVMDDWMSKQNFWKQFLSGIFITIVMTGLDQDMMQKNLTCKTLREAQKDMCTYGFAFVPANMLFMALGILLVMLFQQQGMALPAKGDDLLPMFVESQISQSSLIPVLFTIGIVAASFSSADSALTAMTTSYCVDIRERQGDERLRKRVHILMAVVFAVLILMVDAVNSTSVIDAIYILCSYTYGPLLGLFAYGLLTKRRVNDRRVPYIAVASPVICFVLDKIVASTTGYQFGYELLMLNGLLTFFGLWLSACRR